MILGILRETKKGENRVICTPKEVETITSAGHTVYAQRGCGERAGFSDEAYEAAGALLTNSVQELFKVCDMVAKVKEFTPEEWPLIRTGQLLLGCLHPAANPEEVNALMKSGCIAFTAEDSHRYGSANCEAAGKQGGAFWAGIAADHSRRKGKICRRLCGRAGHPCADPRQRKSWKRRRAGLAGAWCQLYRYGKKYAQASRTFGAV